MHDNDDSPILEVETLIERSVDKVLEGLPCIVDHRSGLVQSMFKALEMDSKWIPLYNITGRLEVPPTPDLDPELESVVSKTKEVPSRFTGQPGYLGGSYSQIIR
jgi:hypothetical protein